MAPPSRGDAVASDIEGKIIPADGIVHGHDGAFGHGVGKTIQDSRRTGDGRKVQDHSVMIALHVLNAGKHAMVCALYVYLIDLVEILGRGVFQSADVRDSGAIDQDIDSLLGNNLAKHAVDALPIGNVATVNTGPSSHIADGVRHRLRLSTACFA